MNDKTEPKTVSQPERREFFRAAKRYGATTALVALGANSLLSDAALAQTAEEEKERQSAAKETMTIATEYRIGTTRSYPVMQLNVKENIQNVSNGQIYVKLSPGGQLGIGTKLAEKVQAGTVQAGQFSLSNFSPFAPAVDLINIPYWVGPNQKFVNLVTSEAWKAEVNSRVEAKGFTPLFYFCIDPRTMAIRQGVQGPIKTPDDLAGMKVRVPGSKNLQQFYQPDSQVYAANTQWLQGLSGELREAIAHASHITFLQNLSQVPASRAYAMAEMAKAGVQFYVPTADEIAAWGEACGHQRPEWDSWKKDLAGSMETFDKLLEAANTASPYFVHDV